MTPPRHRDWAALLPIAAGVFWLSAHHSLGWLLCALLPGSLLLASGVSLLLWPGDSKLTQYMALGGVLGVLFGWPAMPGGGVLAGLIAIVLSVAAFLISGRVVLLLLPPVEGAPQPPMNLKTYAKVALDEALIAYFVGLARIPSGAAAERMSQEAAQLELVLQRRGWLDDPAAFHGTPGVPQDVHEQHFRTLGYDGVRLCFRSEFVVDPELPGGRAWASHERNQQCAALVLRQPAVGRPWLLCVHGYRMGQQFMDLRLFPPHILFRRLALNLVLPTLPLHGQRRVGWQSGDFFLDGDLLDLLYAESQALWDLRRTVAWIRAQDPAARIGVLGYSLGGYNAALLAAHQPGLDFVVAGIPVVDLARELWQHVPVPHREYFAARGVDADAYRRLLRVVSPLACPPQLPRERLHIFAGCADRVVAPDQPLLLAQHWQRPVAWYPGAHLTFRGERAVRDCIEGAMRGAGWALPD